jgi:hypothetical protein
MAETSEEQLPRYLWEARAEVKRLRVQVEADQKRAAAMMRDLGAKWAEAFEGVKSENARLRAALAVYVDAGNWINATGEEDIEEYWWKPDGMPWALAREALSGGATAPEGVPNLPESTLRAPEATVAG